MDKTERKEIKKYLDKIEDTNSPMKLRLFCDLIRELLDNEEKRYKKLGGRNLKKFWEKHKIVKRK